MLALVADHDLAGPVGVGQPTHPVASQHPVDGRLDGRASHAQVGAEPVRARAAAPPSRQHPTDLGRGQAWGHRWGRELPSASPACPC
jgi:hypothetical protein